MQQQREEYRGHSIELRPRERLREEGPGLTEEEEPELLIDGVSVRYGKLPDGSYALDEYAYDWQDDLIGLARNLIDYRDQADETRREDEFGE
jgi:hypothetical protein